MFRKFLIFLLLALAGSAMLSDSNLAGAEVPLSVNTLKGRGSDLPKKYVPPMLGNGSLSLELDWTGGQRLPSYGGIWRAGRRYPTPNANLIPFGWLEQDLSINGKKVSGFESWSQALDTHNGLVVNRGTVNGIEQIMTVFVPLNRDLLAINRKIVNNTDQSKQIRLTLRWNLCPPLNTERLPERMHGAWTCLDTNANQTIPGRVQFDYTVYGHQTSNGRIVLFGGQKETISSIKKNTALLTVDFALAAGASKEIVFYALLADSIDGPNYQAQLEQEIAKTETSGIQALLTEHQADWKRYYSESSVDLPESSLQRMYNTGQYHLRINATRWSFPVGISPRLWHGRYFGWDEMFCHQGLLTAGHKDLARRCPDFRKSCLKTAVYRVAHYGRPGKFGARFVWESLEDGSEGAPSGFWYDHIFHMANIARSAWTQYLYTNDRDYLQSTGYPIVLECARYYRSHWVYQDTSGEMYIGKCTDLERLGPARDHAFMTTCGAIYTMRAAAQAADLLKCDSEEAADFRAVADKLTESLPVRNGAYIAWPGCTEHSVATLGGLFPYDLFDGSNPFQKKAALVYIRDGRANGNMYPVGNSVCPWFAGWMAAAMTLLEDRQEPIKLMREAAGTVGNFGELYEINEEKVSMKPWFSTASGNCVYALNQMLILCRDKEIRLASGVPESWKDYTFRLPAFGALEVEMTVKNGRLAALTLTPLNKFSSKEPRIVTIPDYLLKDVKIDLPSESKNGVTRLTVTPDGKKRIF